MSKKSKVQWLDWKVPLESVDYLYKIQASRLLGLPPVVEADLDAGPTSYNIYKGMMIVMKDQGGFATDGRTLFLPKDSKSLPHAGHWLFYIA